MTTILTVIHILVSLLLIGVVLIQRGQGADMGVSFGGGGAQTLFGSRGSGSFLGKITGGLAATFMVTSLSLAFFSQQHGVSVADKAATMPAQQEQPAAPAAAPAGGFDPSQLGGTAPAAPASAPADGLPAAE